VSELELAVPLVALGQSGACLCCGSGIHTDLLLLETLWPPKRKSTPLARSSLWNIDVMKVPQVFDQVVAAREAFVTNAVTARYRARKFGGTHAMYGGLVALQVGEPCEVCGRGAVGIIAGPSSVVFVSGVVG
jgi:hypothetical protein